MYNLPTNGVKTLLVKLLQVRRLLDYRYGFRLPVSQIELKFLLSPSAKSSQVLVLGPPPVYQDLGRRHDCPV